MWDDDDFNLRKKTTQRGTTTRKRGVFGPGSLRFKKITLELQLDQGLGMPWRILPATAVLNDLSPTGMVLFSNEPLSLTQELQVGITYPRPLCVRGRVIQCSTIETSARVISQNTFKYRIHLEFTFLNDGDAAAVKEYCDQVSGKPKPGQEKVAA